MTGLVGEGQVCGAEEWFGDGEAAAGLACSDGETMLCRVPVPPHTPRGRGGGEGRGAAQTRPR